MTWTDQNPPAGEVIASFSCPSGGLAEIDKPQGIPGVYRLTYGGLFGSTEAMRSTDLEPLLRCVGRLVVARGAPAITEIIGEAKATKDARVALADKRSVPVWETLTLAEQGDTLRNMRDHGGGFVSRLADAWNVADRVNSARLGLAFDDIVRTYLPKNWRV